MHPANKYSNTLQLSKIERVLLGIALPSTVINGPLYNKSSYNSSYTLLAIY